MTPHEKIEHQLPNGDVLIVDATDIRPEVEEAFRQVDERLKAEARAAYDELQEAQPA
jgi:SepF-like predicted cell division protein (DUF552 family)